MLAHERDDPGGIGASCARFRVAAKLGSTNVPANLFPPDSATADRILAGT